MPRLVSNSNAVQSGSRSLPVSDHLRELRSRLFRASLAVAIGVVVGWFLSDVALDLVRAPVVELAASRNATLNYSTIAGAFDLKLRVAIYCGVVLAGPVVLGQGLAFALPGLTGREERWTVGFIATALPLFAAGCTAGVWIFPHIVEVLVDFAPSEDSTVLDAAYYVDFVLKLILVAGVAFVSPVLVVVLNIVGVLPGQTIIRGWRVVIVAVVVFCAIATPSADVESMFLLAVPLCLLFGAAACIALLHDRAVVKRLGDVSTPHAPATPPEDRLPAHS